MSTTPPSPVFTSASCRGETCLPCGAPAVGKVEEVIFWDDPAPHRHPRTAYLCQACLSRTLVPHRRPAPTVGGISTHASTTNGVTVREITIEGPSARTVFEAFDPGFPGAIAQGTTPEDAVRILDRMRGAMARARGVSAAGDDETPRPV